MPARPQSGKPLWASVTDDTEQNNETTNNIFWTCIFNQLDNLASIVWTHFRLNKFADFALSPWTWRTWAIIRCISDDLDISKKRRSKTFN